MATEALSAEAEIGRESEIQAALNEIRDRTTNEEKGGILLFDKEKPTPEQRRANEIYDNLMYTVQRIGETAAKEALKGLQSESYEMVLI